jgi:hypothetical protein
MDRISNFFGKKKKEEKTEKRQQDSKGESRSYFRGFIDHFGFQLPTRELTPEREEELIEALVSKVHSWGLETAAIFFLQSIEAYETVGSSLFLLPAAPFLEFFGVPGYEYSSLFMNRGSVERLMKRIEERSKGSKSRR